MPLMMPAVAFADTIGDTLTDTIIVMADEIAFYAYDCMLLLRCNSGNSGNPAIIRAETLEKLLEGHRVRPPGPAPQDEDSSSTTTI